MSLREHEQTTHTGTSETDAQSQAKPKTAAEAGKPKTRYLLIEEGIYQDIVTENFYERPWINGKRSWRALVGKNIKLSRDEYKRRRRAVKCGENPYAESEQVEAAAPETTQTEPKAPVTEKKQEAPQQAQKAPSSQPSQAAAKRAGPTKAKTGNSPAELVGEVIRRYIEDGYLDKHLLPRPEKTRADEERNCKMLLNFWEFVKVDDVSDVICDEYRDWRLKRVQQGEGLRTTDRELNTMNNAYRYGKRRGIVKYNPFVDRPKYQPSSKVRHCREFMPADSNDLHGMTRGMFENRTSQVLGFQALAEAYSGLRTCEVLKWKANAKPGEFGYVSPDGKTMLVWRCKGQHLVNPYIQINEGMAALLKAHKAWHDKYYPDNEWFFPGHGKGTNKHVDKGALSHALRRISDKRVKRKQNRVKSHGMRAWYVTVRRSWGKPDNIIAFEIGHQSGGPTLSAVYGGVPPSWLEGEGPKMAWLPDGKPAWEAIKLDEGKPA